MKHLRLYLVFLFLGISISASAKMVYFRLDSSLTKQNGVYTLVSKFTIANQGGSLGIDSTMTIINDSIVIISSFVTQGPIPADFTTFYDTIYLNIKYKRKLKILYEVNMWKFGRFVYKYNLDSLYLTSDFLSVQKPNNNADISFRIYPNPAANYAQVTTGSQYASSAYKYVIFSANGRRVLEGELPVSGRLDLTNLLDGLYFIRLYKGHEYSESIKLVIAK